MTAFLKIDECQTCHKTLPWEWVPGIPVNGKLLAGTGVWRTQLINDICAGCRAELQAQQEKREHNHKLCTALIQLLGGEKPYREFTFERYAVAPENRLAYERSKHFNPATDNLYLWGSCGVGKTHLAYACARRCFEETLSVRILRLSQLSRKVRMKEPEQEQAAIDHFVSADVLVLDDMAAGSETVYSRGILQEILDGRDFSDHAGLVLTSKYSLDDLAAKLGDDAIPSRLAGMCSIIQIRGPDGRLTIRTEGR